MDTLVYLPFNVNLHTFDLGISSGLSQEALESGCLATFSPAYVFLSATTAS